MDAFSGIIIIFIGLSVCAFALALMLSIIFNVNAGIKYREPLAKKLYTLRLHKMLSALGINTYEYLHKVNVATINQQITHCSQCVNTEKCDDNISNDNINVDNIDFCNNESSLKILLSKKLAS